jgi:pyruvate-formate lyase
VNDRLKLIREQVLTQPGGDDPAMDSILAASYASSGGEPAVIRKARALAHYYRNRATVIHPGELIVGSCAESPVDDTVDAPSEIPELQPATFHVPDRCSLFVDRHVMIRCGNHTTMDYDTVLNVGFQGIIDRIRSRSKTLAEAGGKQFLEALTIVAEGYIAFCHRYADLALAESRMAPDPQRTAELETIEATCRRVVQLPARTFREACQAAWFAFFFAPDSPGRIDQYLYPLYRKDIDEGRITREEAKELLSCLWAKYQGYLGASENRTGNQHLVLGGTDRAGTDATNELSRLFLDIAEEMSTTRPQASVRWHRNTRSDFVSRAVKVLRNGLGSPGFCSDEVIVPALVKIGVALEDARDFSLSGCHEVIISGKSHMGSVQGMVNMPIILRMALGLERDLYAGADPGRIRSYEDLWEAVIDAMRETVSVMHDFSMALDYARSKDTGRWLELSLVTEGCIETARDILQGGAIYNYCNWDAIGIPNMADGLCAIRRAVFEERRVSLREFADTLRSDWEDNESLRQSILATGCFFGNDCNEVDLIAAEIISTFANLLTEHTPYRQGVYTLGTLAGYENAHTLFGTNTGATPDGRKEGSPLASSLCASPGRDVKGVTAMLNSVAGLPHDRLPTSVTVNVTLQPSLLENEQGMEKIRSLIEGHFNTGGRQLQFTFAGPELLRKARANPEAYGNLMVRVAGYSAPFVSLGADLQDEIIARTEHRIDSVGVTR